ncbi:hypothetical protein BDW74DRAFT_177915 [Aspergillus multicolor]|uniref:Zn(II)2Cys6 transcription factor n=1 Tax=Aspergillus multicolor TaxID=41759 RepID=UPI003CCE410C
MAANQHAGATTTRLKRESRSRKGCPECRSRKIKCDEQRPECGQCLKTGRTCRIVDSLFKQHSYTFLAQSPPKSKPGALPGEEDSRWKSTGNPIQEKEEGFVLAEKGPPWPSKPLRIPQNRGDCTVSQTKCRNAAVVEGAGIEKSLLSTPSERPQAADIKDVESPQDRCEIAFFLRHFCEGPGQWMDICGGQSYFIQNAVVLAHRDPLVRYAACALAAKQLGQSRHPEAHVRQTNTQRAMLKALMDTKLGFTWYGAKYYEKAIQLLAKRITNRESSTSSMSPSQIYGLVNAHSEINSDEADIAFQIIAACILCQYEDVNATIPAWSGHLDGIYRLLLPHLPGSACFQLSTTIPQPAQAMDAVFWFLVVNDLMNAFVTHRKTRIDPDDTALWCRMGLPLNRFGDLDIEKRVDMEFETLLYRALIRILCLMLNADLQDAAQWAMVSEKLEGWQNAVPPSSYVPITWPPEDAEPEFNVKPFAKETWFASDTSAVTLAFYHMSRTILLTERPNNPFMSHQSDSNEEVGTYDAFYQEIQKHSLEIIAIMRGMPSETVQKVARPITQNGRRLWAIYRLPNQRPL